MGIVSWGALAERRAVRSRQTSLIVSLVMVVVCVLLTLKRLLLPSANVYGSAVAPISFLYPLLFGTLAALCLLFAALLRWTAWRWVPLVTTLTLMAFAVTITWVDLHFANDYLAYTIAIFSLGVVFSTSAGGYALILGGSAAVLLTMVSLTMPRQAVDGGFITNFIVLGLAYTGCVLLERQRRQADEMSVRLEELNEQLKETSFRDELTGLYNRRFLVEFLATKRALAVRQSIDLSVVLIDVDHFKKINDTLGHAVGDLVLQRLALTLTDGLREADLAARYGGEEFLLVLPHASVSTAAQAAERILETVKTLTFAGVPWNITFSAGVAGLEGDETVEALLERADRRLYAAKRMRSRVVAED